jgi:hypothetical protein
VLRLLTLDGYKTYLAAAGLLGLAVYQFSQGQVEAALQSLLAAAAAFGLRQAVQKVAPPNPGSPDPFVPLP